MLPSFAQQLIIHISSLNLQSGGRLKWKSHKFYSKRAKIYSHLSNVFFSSCFYRRKNSKLEISKIQYSFAY